MKAESFFTKLLLFLAWGFLTLLVTGCYDDTDLRARLDEHEARLQALEKLCSEMNTNIASLQQIMAALQNNDFVTDVVPISENGKEIGYTITFSKSGAVTIYHGKDGKDGANGKDGKNGVDGKDGADGSTPVVGLKQDTDGIWYWTLNGAWLLDDRGAKVKALGVDGKDGADGKDGKDGANGKDGKDGANGKDGQDGKDGKDGAAGQDGKDGRDGKDGKDGVTPLLKIEVGDWYISYNNGSTWAYVGRADGANGRNGSNGSDGAAGVPGSSFFKSVTDKGDYILLVLSDNTEIKCPKQPATPLSVKFLRKVGTQTVEIKSMDTLKVTINSEELINYQITSSYTYFHVDALGTSDISVITKPQGNNEGLITIKIGDSSVDAYTHVTILVTDEKESHLSTFFFKDITPSTSD